MTETANPARVRRRRATVIAAGPGFTLFGVDNVIIRNPAFRNASDDSMNMQSGTTTIRIDHNDLSRGFSAMKADVFVERNYFENVAEPTITTVAESGPGNIKILDNYKVNSGGEQVRIGANGAAIPYADTPEAAGAGTGQL